MSTIDYSYPATLLDVEQYCLRYILYIDSDRVDEVDDEYGSDYDHDDNDDGGYDLYIKVK